MLGLNFPRATRCLGGALAVLSIGASAVVAEDGASKTRMQIYGHVMLDMGYQVNQSAPDWFDVVRPTKLPSSENEYGADGNWFSGVRQSRLGVRSFTPTTLGELRTTFEFELFGTGVDAGQTTFRLRHAYGELGQFGAGQTWSPFMDIDVFPNSLEYWGPNAMVFFRNVQVRWMPIQGDTRATIALERPGASGDSGEFRSGIEQQDVRSRFPMPDLSAEYHLGQSWGYVEVAGMLRYIAWEDFAADSVDLSGDAVGWGINLSTNVKTGDRGTVRAQVVYGEAIQNYMNDATADVAAVSTSDPTKPLDGKPIPMLGVLAFYDLTWNARWTSSVGYSMLEIDNVTGQMADAFSRGHYALVNLLHHPVENVMVGIEAQYGKRENFMDGFTSDDFRVQFSAKYNFSTMIGG